MRRQARLLAEQLVRGEAITILAGGRSMAGLIEYGDGIVIAPCTGADVKVDDSDPYKDYVVPDDLVW